MAGWELLIGLLAGAGAASVFWAGYCRHLREAFEREREREARIARRGRPPPAATPRSEVAAVATAEENPEGAPSPVASRRLTVLVVERDAEIRRQLVARLAGRGHRAVPSGDAGQALEMARRLRFDLVLVEVGFPGMDWLKVWEEFQRLALTVALLVSEDGAESVSSLPQLDVPVLRKPGDAAQLDRLLRRAASRADSAALRA